MLAMRRLAARPEGIPIAIPQSVSVRVSRKIIQRTLLRCAPKATRTPISRASGKESGKQRDDALVDEKAAHHLVDSSTAKRVFVAKGLDLVADGHRQRFRTFLSANIKGVAQASRLRILKVGKVHDGRRSLAKLQ